MEPPLRYVDRCGSALGSKQWSVISKQWTVDSSYYFNNLSTVNADFRLITDY